MAWNEKINQVKFRLNPVKLKRSSMVRLSLSRLFVCLFHAVLTFGSVVLSSLVRNCCWLIYSAVDLIVPSNHTNYSGRNANLVSP